MSVAKRNGWPTQGSSLSNDTGARYKYLKIPLVRNLRTAVE